MTNSRIISFKKVFVTLVPNAFHHYTYAFGCCNHRMEEKLETMLRLLAARVEFQEGAHARIITRVNFQAWQPPCWPIVHGMVKISRITHRGWKLVVSPNANFAGARVSRESKLGYVIYIYIYVCMDDKLFFPCHNLCFLFLFL